MRSSDIVVDAIATLGAPPYILCEVLEDYEYSNGKRTDNLLGHKYITAIPKLGLERITVKIPGKKLIDMEKGELLNVAFTGLQLNVYTKKDGWTIETIAKAESISLMDDTAKK